MSGARALSPDEVPAVLLRAFPAYRGRSFEAIAAASVTLAGAFWEGGSRSTYRALELATGRTAAAHPAVANPPQYGGPRAAVTVAVPVGWAIVEHSISCGRDEGLRFHVHPGSVAALLPAPATAVELSEAARVVLVLAVSLKSFARREYAARAGVKGAAYDSALGECRALGYVDTRGAVTVAGRNLARSPALAATARRVC